MTNNAAPTRPLTVAVSFDIPPYVMGKAMSGFEVELMSRLLSTYALKWLQTDYLGLESAVPDKKAEVAMSVQGGKAGVFYSADYIGFVNVAISKQVKKLNVERIQDLKGHKVLTWENAWLELGDEFKNQYAPGSPERANYIEVADQAEQMWQFWEAEDKIIVIDQSIFDYVSKDNGRSLGEVKYHKLFPRPTRFKVAFANAALRDEFNARLKELCASGEYNRLLSRYGIPELAGVSG